MEKLLHVKETQRFIYQTGRIYRAEYSVDINRPGKVLIVTIYGIYAPLNKEEKKAIKKTLRKDLAYLEKNFKKPLWINS